MKRRPLLSLLASLSTLLLLGITAETAHAISYTKQATVTVPLGLTPNDLHATFTGTGGSISNPSVVPAQGAGSIGVGGGGNRIDVVWDAKLAPATLVTLTFTTNFPDVGFAGGVWTNNGDTIGTVSGVEITQLAASPGVSPLVLLLITLLVGAAAILAIRRRAVA